MTNEFVCVITCMDGRIQEAVNTYMKNKFQVVNVDTITAAGPAKVLAENKKDHIIKNIKYRTDVSVNAHHSKNIVVVGHFDCALIKKPDDIQKQYIKDAVKLVESWYDNVSVKGVFVDSDLNIIEL